MNSGRVWVRIVFLVTFFQLSKSQDVWGIVLPTISPQASTSCTTAAWLAWSDWSSCSDTCGSCGVHLRTRTCLTTDSSCTCAGSATDVEYCNLEICRYPRSTCCYNLKVTALSGKFACLSTSPAPAPTA
ncbi:unnamed protein product [Caenorhabditis auriculariae]|uniref:Uncharacterized protein n=1 Tax=Caenorhabditis auriculariae TaxID=2777116 RepID=A0A8S1HJC9_9PELO|nr:unnamed protein product [Caenorhabditis auriculariae]